MDEATKGYDGKVSLGAKPLAFPHPVYVVGSYSPEGRANIMVAAWGGICSSRPPSIAISLRAATASHGYILQRRAFTVGIPPTGRVREVDYAGMFSGRDEDKFAVTGLTPVASTTVDAPYVQEFPLVLECRLLQTIDLGLHTEFVGEILDVKADPAILDEAGQPSILRIDPLVYSSGDRCYYRLGSRVQRAFAATRQQK